MLHKLNEKRSKKGRNILKSAKVEKTIVRLVRKIAFLRDKGCVSISTTSIGKIGSVLWLCCWGGDERREERRDFAGTRSEYRKVVEKLRKMRKRMAKRRKKKQNVGQGGKRKESV